MHLCLCLPLFVVLGPCCAVLNFAHLEAEKDFHTAIEYQSPLDKLMRMNYNAVNRDEFYSKCEQNFVSEGAAMQNDQVGKAIPWNPWHGCEK